MRFHPDEYMDLMINKMNEIASNSTTNIDYIPGFMYGINGEAGGRTMLFKSNDMALYRNAHTYLQIYMIDPTSSSWTVELPYLYYINHIDNPNYFTACYFDIGEPILLVGKDKIEGDIVSFTPGDFHNICRIDLVKKESIDNIFDIKKPVESTQTDMNSVVTVSKEKDFAVMGVVAPTTLDDVYVFDQYSDNIQITNRIEKLAYHFVSNNSSIDFIKPVYLTRKNVEEKAGNYDSVLEYYHVFDTSNFEVGKSYQVSIKGLDKNNNEIEGTEEHFLLRCISE